MVGHAAQLTYSVAGGRCVLELCCARSLWKCTKKNVKMRGTGLRMEKQVMHVARGGYAFAYVQLLCAWLEEDMFYNCVMCAACGSFFSSCQTL